MSEETKPTPPDLSGQLAEARAIIGMVEQQRNQAYAETKTLEIHLALVRAELDALKANTKKPAQ